MIPTCAAEIVSRIRPSRRADTAHTQCRHQTGAQACGHHALVVARPFNAKAPAAAVRADRPMVATVPSVGTLAVVAAPANALYTMVNPDIKSPNVLQMLKVRALLSTAHESAQADQPAQRPAETGWCVSRHDLGQVNDPRPRVAMAYMPTDGPPTGPPAALFSLSSVQLFRTGVDKALKAKKPFNEGLGRGRVGGSEFQHQPLSTGA